VGGGEGDVLVVVLSGVQAVVQAAEEPVEQVALGGGVEGSRFRRQSPKWHDGLRGEEQKWDRHAGSSLLSIRLKL
jgi:hypothetical protein